MHNGNYHRAGKTVSSSPVGRNVGRAALCHMGNYVNGAVTAHRLAVDDSTEDLGGGMLANFCAEGGLGGTEASLADLVVALTTAAPHSGMRAMWGIGAAPVAF